MKTVESVISQIEKLAYEVRESSAEKIINFLGGNKILFDEVFDEEWFRQSAFKLDDLVRNKVEETNPSKFQQQYTLIVANLLYHLKRNYIN